MVDYTNYKIKDDIMNTLDEEEIILINQHERLLKNQVKKKKKLTKDSERTEYE